MNEVEKFDVDTMNDSGNQESKLIDIKNLDSGLEILVDLAEKGEIDPWDLDLAEVTNKYLAALNSTPRENLLNAGRAIFYASVLLRMKSEILLNISNETLMQSQETEDFFPEDFNSDDVIKIDNAKLETFINRSSLGKHQRKRKIILSDLIFALQQAEEEEELRARRARLRSERREHLIIAPEIPDDVMEMAHEEDIEDIVERIESIIQEHLTDEKPITFSYLCGILNNKTKPFLSLLFMAHRGAIVIEQKEIYGEIYIYKAGKITDEMKEQIEANRLAEEEEKERIKKEKEKKKRKRLGDKIKGKVKETAQKIKDALFGADEKVSEPEILPPVTIENSSEEKEPNEQTLSMSDESATTHTEEEEEENV